MSRDRPSQPAVRVVALGISLLLSGCGGSSGPPPVAVVPPAAPQGLQAAPAAGAVTLTWTASVGATSYQVARSAASTGPFAAVGSPTTTSYTDTSVGAGLTYFYVVAASGAGGTGPASADVAASVPPAAPSGLSASVAGASVALAWTAVGGATTYAVYRASGGAAATLLANVATPSYTDTAVALGTTYTYTVTASDAGGSSPPSAAVTATPATGGIVLTLSATAGQAISPYIYGLNGLSQTARAPSGLALDRLGGNRWTAYNWVTNASNAGSDYLYENDAYLSASSNPAAAVTLALSADQAAGAASLVTVQMQGLVAADEAGPVDVTNPPASDAARFKPALPAKGAAFTTTPLPTAPAVYMDEFLYALDRGFAGQGIFSTTPGGQPVFVELDNEPELWNQTHREVQGSTPVSSADLLARTRALAGALKSTQTLNLPGLRLFGPVDYGFLGLYNWNNDPAISATPTGGNWFFDHYVAAVGTAQAGAPLVDVYDFHWYPEATDSGGTRITTLTGPTLTADQVQAIVQSPRSLWDPGYTERSWITQLLGGPIDLLDRLQSKLRAASSPMGLAITEYNNGGGQHIAGLIATADNLGAFGEKGVYAAAYWQLAASEPYPLGAFSSYRDFDGAGANFGDRSVGAVSSDASTVTAYASLDTARPGRVVIVAINRSPAAQPITVQGALLSGTAHLYQTTAATGAAQAAAGNPVRPVASGTVAVGNARLSVSLPALSVTTIDVY